MTDPLLIALVAVELFTLADMLVLHWAHAAPAHLIMEALIAVTIAAGRARRPGALAMLAYAWWAWTAVSVADIGMLHLLGCSPINAFISFLIVGYLLEAGHRALPQQKASIALRGPVQHIAADPRGAIPKREAA